MDARFSRRTDGVIDVDLGPEWVGLTEALMDAVTTRAPRGSDGINPSTYWIDRTMARLMDAQDGSIVASGNATDLISAGNEVVAHSQYDTFADQSVPRADLVYVLNRWRAEVTTSRSGTS
jgi:hypothetical protein